MFEKSREKYKDSENKLLVAKIADKFEFCKTRNKITYTDFLDISEMSVVKRILLEEKINNWIIFGGRENADRNIIIFYPEKFSKEMVEKNYSKILEVIRIKLPNNLNYEHREFLSGIMKLGIKREKFGDILVTNTGADIISLCDVSKYLQEGLNDLTRFKKSIITIENIKNIEKVENEFEDIKIVISSMRLDNFVSELAKCSRTRASEIIEGGKVFINSVNEFKDSKKIELNDIITIRGKGKFIFSEIEKETKSGKFLVNIKKYK